MQPSNLKQKLSDPPEPERPPVTAGSVQLRPFSADHCRQVLDLIASETAANLTGLRIRGNPRPFFLSNLLRHETGCKVRATYGSLFTSRQWEKAEIYSDIRVGSHRLDQTLDGGLNDDLEERISASWTEAPVDLEPDGLRYALWKLMQLKYEEALQSYYDKRKVMVGEFLRHRVDNFSVEPRLELLEPLEPVQFPVTDWEQQAREISTLFRQHEFISDPQVSFWATAATRFFASTEGTRCATRDCYYQLSIQAWVRTRDGVYLPGNVDWYARRPTELPTMEQVHQAVQHFVEHLTRLQQAPALGAYVGPALLSGQAAAVFFHEAIGHRLEGERLICRREGKTFLGKVGEAILPDYLHVHDDPTLTELEGVPLFGSYRVDDQGVRPGRVALVEHGRLVDYLKSRAAIPGSPHSNGHARAEGILAPMARMGNLIITSGQQHTWAELKLQLRAECRRQGRPFGLIIEHVSSGETSTDSYDFQSFKGEPSRVWRVATASGREELVRDVAFIGTPLAALQKIIATGNQLAADNGYCGAESGEVPVSNISPPILLSELELQRKSTHSYHKPVLPLPWHRAG